MTVAHVHLVPLEQGRDRIAAGAVCAMKGQARDYWPRDNFDEELRAMLIEEDRDRSYL